MENKIKTSNENLEHQKLFSVKSLNLESTFFMIKTYEFLTPDEDKQEDD